MRYPAFRFSRVWCDRHALLQMCQLPPSELPEVLSLDEFKGNSGRQKYNSISVDAEKHRVIDILPNRFENDLIKYFSQFPSKSGVKHFVKDMNPHFRRVAGICFPKAAIVNEDPQRRVLWNAEFLKFQKSNHLLPYIKSCRGFRSGTTGMFPFCLTLA